MLAEELIVFDSVSPSLGIIHGEIYLDEWLFASVGDGIVVDKGQQLTTFTRQGRCVLMGNQSKYN